MFPLHCVFQVLAVLAGQQGIDPKALGIELPARLAQSPDLWRWQALVQDDGLPYNPASEKKLAQALALAEKLDPEGPVAALSLIRIGSFQASGLNLANLEKHESVRSHFTRAIGILEKRYGREHPAVALGLHELGAMLALVSSMSFDDDELAEKQLREAEKHCLEALAIRKKTRGSLHAEILESHRMLAVLYEDLADHSAALRHLRQAIEQAAGRKRQELNLAELYESLAGVELKLGNWKQAEQAFLERLRAVEAVKPLDIAALVAAHDDLGDFFLRRGRHGEAEAQYRAGIDAAGKEKESAIDLSRTWEGLARALQAQRQSEKAQDAWVRLLKLQSVDSEDTYPAIETLVELVRLQRDVGRLTEARAHLEAASKSLAKLLPQDPDHATLHWRALLLVEQGKLRLREGNREAGAADLRRSLTLNEESYCVQCYHAADAWHEIGRLQVAAGKLVEAEGDLRRALEILDGRQPAAGDIAWDDLQARVLQILADTCRKNGKESEAKALLDRTQKRPGNAP